MIRVGIVGYGTIGKGVARAIGKQDDMEVIGVVKTRPDFIAKLSPYPIYTYEDRIKDFEEAGISVAGTVEELIEKADVIVDATPSKIGAKNKETLYSKFDKPVIFQGGEKASVADVSFNAEANYREAVGKRYVRVVSCNTTGLIRSLYRLDKNIGIERVHAVLIRRAADPHEDKKGPINAIMPKPIKGLSHHAEDVRTVLDVNITTMASVVPTTIMHVHALRVKFKRDTSEDEVIDALSESKRIVFVEGKLGFTSTAKIIEAARDLGRPRNDRFELIVRRDSISVSGREAFFRQAVHQEAIVVPENIDAMRAVSGFENAEESINKTNSSLGLGDVRWRRVPLIRA
jgi:glyceraldehyde-3-phosphate dehydrogenase (NAD(P))